VRNLLFLTASDTASDDFALISTPDPCRKTQHIIILIPQSILIIQQSGRYHSTSRNQISNFTCY